MNFRDTEHSQVIHDECEALGQSLRDEFRETSRVEVTVSHDRGEYEAHVHVTGKDIDLASSAKARESIMTAAREAFHRAHTQLRKHHEKAIFKHRRDHE